MKLILRAVFSCLVAGSLSLSESTLAASQFKTLNYLQSIRGIHTLGGLHNREPNSDPNVYSRELNSLISQWPALYSADFLFNPDDIANRQTMINQVKVEWNNGAVINLLWHACNPAKSEPCYYSKPGGTGPWSVMSDAEWNQLMTDGSPINTEWKRRMDKVAVFLSQLQAQNIEVMFRPLHEMNHPNAFWWAGRPGPNGSAKLFRMTHDYFTNTKNLKNLIWVWDLQDFSTLESDVNDFDPGSNYWDVLALDNYGSDGQGYTQKKYDIIVNKAAGKPIGIGECATLPSPTILNQQPLWTFFVGWAEWIFQSKYNPNPIQTIKDLYLSNRVLTLNELPDWHKSSASSSSSANSSSSASSSSSSNTLNAITVQAENYSNMSGVMTESTSDIGGGKNIGAIDTGDWLSFSNINISASGNYTVSFRVASPVSSGKLQFERAGGGQIFAGPISIPNTGGWQNWTTLSQTINLNAGPQNFGIKALAGSWNLNWFSLTPVATSSSASTIQAEDFTNMSGVIPEASSDVGGGTDIGGIDTGDWLSYSKINIPTTGTYSVKFRVASPTGGRIQLEKAGGGVNYGSVIIPATGGWQNWQTVEMIVTFTAGAQDFGIKAVEGNWNFNWWSLTPLQ